MLSIFGAMCWQVLGAEVMGVSDGEIKDDIIYSQERMS